MWFSKELRHDACSEIACLKQQLDDQKIRLDRLKARLDRVEKKLSKSAIGNAEKNVRVQSLNLVRQPYERRPTEWRRFELLTENEAEENRLERLLAEKNLTRQDLAIILFSLRVRPEFGKKDFDI